MKVLFSFLPFLILTFFSFFTVADLELDEASQQLIYDENLEDTKKVDLKSKKFNLQTSFSQSRGFIESRDSLSQISLNLAYFLRKSLSFSVSQSLSRNYFLNPRSQDYGFRLQDMSFSLNQKISGPYKSDFSILFSSTLPLSLNSRMRDVFSVSSFSLSGSLDLMPLLKWESLYINSINFFIKPLFRYYFSEYKTTRTYNEKGQAQTSGGNPLPQFVIGLSSFGLNFQIMKKLSLSTSLGAWRMFPYVLSYSNKESPYKGRRYQKNYYLISLSLGYQILKNWSFALSYSLSDSFEKYGRLQKPVIYDYELSSWAFSTSWFFSFNSFKDIWP